MARASVLFYDGHEYRAAVKYFPPAAAREFWNIELTIGKGFDNESVIEFRVLSRADLLALRDALADMVAQIDMGSDMTAADRRFREIVRDRPALECHEPVAGDEVVPEDTSIAGDGYRVAQEAEVG